MTMRIYKHALADLGPQEVSLGVGARILAIGEQAGGLVVWVEEPARDSSYVAPEEDWVFYTCYTGFAVPEGTYIGTVLSLGGTFVRHVYAEKLV